MSGAGAVRIRLPDGAYLCRFWLGWLEHGDDPTTWSEKRASALLLSPQRLAKVLPYVEAFHGPAIVELVSTDSASVAALRSARQAFAAQLPNSTLRDDPRLSVIQSLDAALAGVQL